MSEKPLARIRSISRFMRALALAGLIGLVGLAIWAAMDPGRLVRNVENEFYGPITVTPGSELGLLLVFFAALLPPVYTLLQVRNLFALFADGRVFEAEAGLAIRRTGFGLMAMALTGILSRMADIVILTINNPPGQRALSISMSSDTYLLILFSGLFITLGLVLGEAAEMSEENRQFV